IPGRALPPVTTNVQPSWVKVGREGVKTGLRSGANDLGGTLMDETITRSAGASHGREMTPVEMENTIRSLGRVPRQRDTLYRTAPQERYRASFGAVGGSQRRPSPPIIERNPRSQRQILLFQH